MSMGLEKTKGEITGVDCIDHHSEIRKVNSPKIGFVAIENAFCKVTLILLDILQKKVYIFECQRLPWSRYVSKIAHYHEGKGEK